MLVGDPKVDVPDFTEHLPGPRVVASLVLLEDLQGLPYAAPGMEVPDEGQGLPLELALGDPAISANFVELRRVTSELADVDAALAAAEDAWLELEERAP